MAQKLILNPGYTYNIAFYAKATYSGPPLIWRLYISDWAGKITPYSTIGQQLYAAPVSSSADFVRYTAPFTAPDNMIEAMVWVNFGPLFNPGVSLNYQWWLDDFEVVDAAEVCDGNIPPPPTVTSTMAVP